MTTYHTPSENAEMAKAYMESYAEKYQDFQGMDVVDYAHLDFISNKWSKWAAIYLAYKTLSGEK